MVPQHQWRLVVLGSFDSVSERLECSSAFREYLQAWLRPLGRGSYAHRHRRRAHGARCGVRLSEARS
jgi:hypothetical protein